VPKRWAEWPVWMRSAVTGIAAAVLAAGAFTTGYRLARPSRSSLTWPAQPAPVFQPTGAAPFPQFGADPHTHNPVFPAAFTPRWTVPVPGQAIYQDSYDPTTGDVYAESMSQTAGWLWAIDARTGRIRWSWQAPNQLMDTPTVADGLVFVGYGNAQFNPRAMTPHATLDGYYCRGTGVSGVAALDARTGRVVWVARTRGNVMPTLTYWRGAVYVVTG